MPREIRNSIDPERESQIETVRTSGPDTSHEFRRQLGNKLGLGWKRFVDGLVQAAIICDLAVAMEARSFGYEPPK
jgi:hypothetical protein